MLSGPEADWHSKTGKYVCFALTIRVSDLLQCSEEKLRCFPKTGGTQGTLPKAAKLSSVGVVV